MTRLLLTADQHLGKGQDLGRTPGERLAEQESVWAATLALSRDRRCDAVLHGGDLFDGRRPGPDVMLAAERPLVEHQVQGGPTVYVCAGNHDVPSQDGPCGLDVLAEAGLIELAREPRAWTVAGVDVCALPWTPVARLIALDGGESDRAEIHQRAAELVVQVAGNLFSETLVSRPKASVLLGHWAVTDTVLPNGLDVGSLRGVVLPMADLQAIGFDQICFGHIHSPQAIDSFLYVGSPQQLDHGDCGSERGAWVWDDGHIEFMPLLSRRFVTLDLESASGHDGLDGAFVKVCGPVDEEQYRRLDLAALRDDIEAAGAYSVTFDVTVERARRDRAHVLADGQSRVEQLAAYLEATGVNGSTGAAMIARAERYLEGAGA